MPKLRLKQKSKSKNNSSLKLIDNHRTLDGLLCPYYGDINYLIQSCALIKGFLSRQEYSYFIKNGYLSITAQRFIF